MSASSPLARQLLAATLVAAAWGARAQAEEPTTASVPPEEASDPAVAPSDPPEAPSPTPEEASATPEKAAHPPEDPAAERKAARTLRRAQKRAARRERWAGPILPPEADFLRRHVDVRARLAFNGYNPGPFSLFTALSGWNELSIVVDAGALSFRDWTVGFGGSAHFGQAWILSAVTQPVSNYDEYAFRWQMWEAGGVFRTTFHYTGLSSVDPYLVVGVGAAAFHLEAQVKDWPRDTRQALTRPYVRGELGGGLSWRLRGGWIAGGEIRYLVSSQIDPQDRFVHTRGDEIATFVFAPQHRPPKGFSWVVHVGYRF